MARQLIGVVDYGGGNLKSVETALEYLDASFLISREVRRLEECGKLIFPGVGDAGASMEVLKQTGLDAFLKDWAQSGGYLLGICVGCQLLFEFSEERNTDCLGILPGRVRIFPRGRVDARNNLLKVPHMGWNQVEFDTKKRHPLFAGIPPRSSFYFVHSYYPEPADPGDCLAITDYIGNFVCAVGRGRVMATQFHPEKSGELGLKFLA